MAIPATIAGGVAAKAVGYIPKLLAGIKGLSTGQLLGLLATGGFLGSTALTEYGKVGERGLSREQIALQKILGESQAKATKRSVKEDRAKSDKYMKTLLKMQQAEKREARDAAMMQSFTQSQDRQMAMIMQAVQAQSQRQMGAATQSSGVGMISSMRSNY